MWSIVGSATIITWKCVISQSHLVLYVPNTPIYTNQVEIAVYAYHRKGIIKKKISSQRNQMHTHTHIRIKLSPSDEEPGNLIVVLNQLNISLISNEEKCFKQNIPSLFYDLPVELCVFSPFTFRLCDSCDFLKIKKKMKKSEKRFQLHDE